MKWTKDKLDSYYKGAGNGDEQKEEQIPKCDRCGAEISRDASMCRKCFREYMSIFTKNCIRESWTVNNVINKINKESVK